MTKINIGSLLITSLFITGIFSGCSKDHLDPSQIGRFRPVPAVNVILDTLGVAEESASAYEGAEDPRPADVVAYEQDYSFSSGDVIRIAVFELLQEGAAYVDNYVVSESGNISIPEIGQLQAGGLTESQLADEIRQALSPGILKNPSVTVSLVSSQSRMFTILGDGVAVPNRYGIPRYDFRLLDALATAGSAKQFNVSYIYIARRLTGQEQQIGQDTGLSLRPVEAGDNLNQSDSGYKLPEEINDSEMLEVIEPSIFPGQLVISSAEMVTEKELVDLARPEVIANENAGQRQNPVTVSNTIPQTQQDNARVEWIFKDGKWIPVQVGIADQKPVRQDDTVARIPAVPQRQDEQVQPKQPFDKQALPESYGWEDIQSAGVQSRVIKIPKDKLYGGDPRYNIIIKPGDTITVQLDVVGEFYVLGNANNQGVINLTGRPMTLKMAIAAAGGLGPLAWPKKCEVIRRIGEKKEEIVMVDLEKIANGSQPDFFIKPNDVINVGTHGVSRWLASLRNAFRATYGFGFLYDRNFGNRSLELSNPMLLLENP